MKNSTRTIADLEELTIQEMQARMAAGALTSEQLTAHYLLRIETIDAGPDGLHSVNTINPSALDIARTLDKERASGQLRGPLHGVPILLKDNIDTADKMPNTGGSVLLKDNYPSQDAFLVSQLRKAGAVILGKTNLSEWANFRSERASSGWSSFGGQVHNPYDRTRSPCGSSSGSGVAVAANFTAGAIGTETNGSVVCPATFNGIVGIKPSLGRVSRQGIIPIAHSQDTAGPMARTVADAVLILDAMVGADSADSITRSPEGQFSGFLNPDGLQGKRIGVVTNMMGYHDQVDSLFTSQLKVLEVAGATVTHCELENRRKFGKPSYEVLLYEFKQDIAAYLATTTSPYRTLADLIAGNEKQAELALPIFGQEIFTAAEGKGDLDSEAYQTALAEAKRLAGLEGIDATLANCEVDLLIAPTGAPAWKIDHVNGDNFLGSASGPAAVAGYPHITVPMGFVSGLPVGLSFFAGFNQEGLLIEAAYSYEQATRHRRPPVL